MNVRSLVKLRKILLSEIQDRAYDNFYEHKLEVWHGPKEAPYHDAVCFTDVELQKFLNNLNELHSEITRQLNEKVKIESQADE